MPATGDVRQLSSELARLGDPRSADTRVGWFEVVCRVIPSGGKQPHTAEVCSPSEVLLRNPVGGEEHRYRTSLALPPTADEGAVFDEVGCKLRDWIGDGFNASVIAYGATGTGKTHTLFGRGGCDPALTLTRGAGLCGRLLAALFDADPRAVVALSAWEMAGDSVTDLLAGAPAPTHDYVSVRARDLQTATDLLHLARRRSASWTRGSPVPSLKPNRAHTVVRVVLLRGGRVSSLHLVDLAGFEPLGSGSRGAGAAAAAADPVVETLQQDNVAFSKLIAQLAQHDVARKGVPQAHAALPVPQSAFTDFLGSLMAGNSKTFMLACVRDGADRFTETIQTLRVASRMLAIASACSQLVGFTEEDLELERAATVLPGPEGGSAVVVPVGSSAGPVGVGGAGSAEFEEEVVVPAAQPPAQEAAAQDQEQEEEEDTEAWLQRYMAEKNAIMTGPLANALSSPEPAPAPAPVAETTNTTADAMMRANPPPDQAHDQDQAQGQAHLLHIIQDDHQALLQRQSQVAHLQNELEEQRLAHELAADDLRAEVAALKGTLRQLQQDKMAEVFERYEDDMARLQAEVRHWRKENLKLEMRGRLDTIVTKKRLTEARREADQLLGRIWDMKKNERQHQLQMALREKVISAGARDLEQASARLVEHDRELTDRRLAAAALEARAFRAEGALQEMTRARDELLDERRRTNEELESMRLYVEHMDQRRKQDTIVNRMRSKHGGGGGGGRGRGRKRGSAAAAAAPPPPPPSSGPPPSDAGDAQQELAQRLNGTLAQMGGELRRATDLRRALPVLNSLHSKLAREVGEVQAALKQSEEQQNELLAALVDVS